MRLSRGVSVMYWDPDPSGHMVLKGPAEVVAARGQSVTLRRIEEFGMGGLFRVLRTDVEPPKRKARTIARVFLRHGGERADEREDIKECVAQYRQLGRNPQVYMRGLRAEWLGADCYIVVVDKEEKL
jgi:hypothetical protein